MKKRIAALVLCTALITGALMGCGNTNTPVPGATSGSASDTAPADTQTASATEKVKLKALVISHPLTQDITNMQWVKEIEEEAGVEIEWEQIRADWDTVKSTRFASGDIPDLLFSATVDSDYTKYDGLFMDLSSYINESATPNIAAMFNEEPDTKVLAQTMEGKIFGLPKFQGKWPTTNTVMFINQQWLDNLGIQMPTTYTEFKQVLTAFREEDANGNGDASDEIPLDYNAYGGNNAFFNSAYSLTNLLGSLGIQLTDWGTDAYFAQDSTVKCYAVDERYKLFMKYLADLYENGLINPNALTNDYSAFQSLSRGNENGEAVVGCVFGWEETDKFGNELAGQYKPVPALEYDIDCEPGTYDTRWRDDYTGLNMAGNRVCVSAKCADPEAAMRFLDRFYDSAVSVQGLFGGISDGCVEQIDGDNFKVLPPKDPSLDPGTWKWTSSMADNAPMYIRRSTQIQMAQDMTNALEERVAYDETVAKASTADTYPQMFMKYSEEDQNTMALTQANINNIIDNQWSLWMTGEQDIDASWDAYVDSVNAAGLPQILEIRQNAFDEYLKNAAK